MSRLEDEAQKRTEILQRQQQADRLELVHRKVMNKQRAGLWAGHGRVVVWVAERRS